MDELTDKVKLLLDKTTDPKIKLRYESFLKQNEQIEPSLVAELQLLIDESELERQRVHLLKAKEVEITAEQDAQNDFEYFVLLLKNKIIKSSKKYDSTPTYSNIIDLSSNSSLSTHYKSARYVNNLYMPNERWQTFEQNYIVGESYKSIKNVYGKVYLQTYFDVILSNFRNNGLDGYILDMKRASVGIQPTIDVLIPVQATNENAEKKSGNENTKKWSKLDDIPTIILILIVILGGVVAGVLNV